MTANYPTAIIESESLVREGLRLLLEKTPFSPQVCAADVDDLELVADDSLIIFFSHDKFSVQDLVVRLRERFPRCRLVGIADESRSECLASALEAGANAALFTSITPAGLVSALHAVVSGDVVVMDARVWPKAGSPFPERQAASAPRAPEALHLSPREADILHRIACGDSNKHIARRFEIAEATVKAHMKAILRKIGANNRTQAAMWAVNNGLFIAEEDDFAGSANDFVDRAALRHAANGVC